MIHDIIGNQRRPIMNKNHAPLQMDADFIGPPRELAKAEAPVLMRISKSRGDLRNGLGSFFA